MAEEEEANVELRAQLIGTRCHTAPAALWSEWRDLDAEGRILEVIVGGFLIVHTIINIISSSIEFVFFLVGLRWVGG